MPKPWSSKVIWLPYVDKLKSTPKIFYFIFYFILFFLGGSGGNNKKSVNNVNFHIIVWPRLSCPHSHPTWPRLFFCFCFGSRLSDFEKKIMITQVCSAGTNRTRIYYVRTVIITDICNTLSAFLGTSTWRETWGRPAFLWWRFLCSGHFLNPLFQKKISFFFLIWIQIVTIYLLLVVQM